MKRELLILGHSGHGKNTVAELLNKHYGYTFLGSSMAAARFFLYQDLKEKYGYNSLEECYEDRHNHRAEWYDAICEYNKEDPALLAREILSVAEIYVGMRSERELLACIDEGLFELIIGVYCHYKPVEPTDSNSIDLWKYADIVIPTSNTLEDLENRIITLWPLFEMP